MSSVRDMIDAIGAEDFDSARASLKTSLAEYMTSTKYVSNKDVFGDKYTNPNEEEQEAKAELTEACKKKNKKKKAVKSDDETPEKGE